MARTSNLTDDEIIKLYNEGHSIYYMIKYHHVGHKRVKEVLQKAGLT